MSDELALRALTFRLLADRVKQADATNRRLIAEQFEVGDRKKVWLPGLYGQDIEIGHVRRDAGSTTASVTNMAELVDWCEANYPGEVEEHRPEPITRVRPAFLDRLLAEAKGQGAAVTSQGEFIPGVTVAHGDPKTVVVAAKTLDAEAALMDLLRSDPGALGSLLNELPAGTS